MAWIEEYCKNNNPNWNNLTKSEQADIILAAYNCGQHKLKTKGWNINFNEETASHIRKIHEIIG